MPCFRPVLAALCILSLGAAEPALTVTAKELRGLAGSEGSVVDGTFRSIVADGIHRLKFPLPGAGVPLADDTRCVVEVETAQATTVAVMLVVKSADGGWLGNLQGERRIAAGRHTIAWSLAELTSANGKAGAGGIARDLILMSWAEPTELRLHRAAIGATAK